MFVIHRRCTRPNLSSCLGRSVDFTRCSAGALFCVWSMVRYSVFEVHHALKCRRSMPLSGQQMDHTTALSVTKIVHRIRHILSTPRYTRVVTSICDSSASGVTRNRCTAWRRLCTPYTAPPTRRARWCSSSRKHPCRTTTEALLRTLLQLLQGLCAWVGECTYFVCFPRPGAMLAYGRLLAVTWEIPLYLVPLPPILVSNSHAGCYALEPKLRCRPCF